MTIWNNDECRQKYGYLARSGIADHMLCAYPPKQTIESEAAEGVAKSKDGRGRQAEIQDCIVSSHNQILSPTCLNIRRIYVSFCNRNLLISQGDSGGPLAVQNKNGKYEQVHAA
jgi:hypothetical protein